MDSLSLVDLLKPVSFVYNGSEQVRYGFIAEDTAAVDAHLATYDASGNVSGIDDRSILAVVIGAIKQLWQKVLALIASDEAQNARIQLLEQEVAALKAAAGTPGDESGAGAPSGSSVPVVASADTATTTTGVEEETAAGAASDVAEAPEAADGSSAQGETGADTGEATPPSSNEPVPEGTPEPELAPANDNDPADPLPAAEAI